MRVKILSVAACLGTCFGLGPAAASPLIGAVDWDRATYRASDQPVMTVSLGAGAPAGGVVQAVLSDDHARTRASLSSGAGGGRATFRLPAGLPAGGYHVALTVRDASGAALDTEAGAFDVAAPWARFPRYCFVSGSSVTRGAPVAGIVARLASYRCNAIQWYDVNWKHQEPYSPAASWPNTAAMTIDRATLLLGLHAASARGIANLDYALWNGAWDGYGDDGSGVPAAAELFKSACYPHCTPADHLHYGPFPHGWSTRLLWQMNPADAQWIAHWNAAEGDTVRHLGFDGVQIDTLGDPGPVWDAGGHAVHLAAALAPFAAAVHAALGVPVLANAVSGWGLAGLVAAPSVAASYAEMHPENGDLHALADLETLGARMRGPTGLSPIVAMYVDTARAQSAACRAPGSACTVGIGGVEALDAEMMAAGIDHWELGDVNESCAVPQPKLATNIYVSGPALCMDAELVNWERDARDFAVSYENILRGSGVRHVAPASLGAVVRGAGAAHVHVIAGVAEGRRIVSLLGGTAGRAVRLDDPDGAAASPPTLDAVGLTLRRPGAVSCRLRVWWASPEVRHGAPALLPYRCTGSSIEVTVPTLQNWDMVVIENGA